MVGEPRFANRVPMNNTPVQPFAPLFWEAIAAKRLTRVEICHDGREGTWSFVPGVTTISRRLPETPS